MINRFTALSTFKQLRTVAIAFSLCIVPFGVLSDETSCDCEVKENYPTPVIADYVLACMAANGNSFASLHQCSCSIDLIMSKIAYEDYEKVTTIMQVQLDKGQRGIFYRDSSWAKNNVELFERVQAESTLKCF